jgi:L-amino acid N-acyltransferase YncA
MTIIVRACVGQDMPALCAIYAHHVLYGLGTFDEVPPSVGEFGGKWRDIEAMGLPWLVACDGEEAVGYAYASAFRSRTGYRYTVEDSVYIRDDCRGRGLGRALLAPLLKRCEDIGARQVVAVIGDSQNLASLALHRRFGFSDAGMVKSAGYKLGRWVDIVIMQTSLNGGNGSAPPSQGAWH